MIFSVSGRTYKRIPLYSLVFRKGQEGSLLFDIIEDCLCSRVFSHSMLYGVERSVCFSQSRDEHCGGI